MGLLNLTDPVFGWLDLQLGLVLPDAVRLVLWAFAVSLASMYLYKALSPQARIAGLRDEVRAAQRELDSHAESLAEAWPLIRRSLRLALLRVAIVLPATLVAGLPVLVVIVWLSSAYGHVFPAGGPAAVATHVEPAGFDARLETVNPAANEARLVVTDPAGRVVTDVVMQEPVPVVAKHQWWNFLLGNPAGYLPNDAPVEHISIDLPRREVIGLGADWMRSWEALFFTVLVICSLAIKHIARIA